jgi:hypothetical protein
MLAALGCVAQKASPPPPPAPVPAQITNGKKIFIANMGADNFSQISFNKLQDPANKRNINADENLKKVFGGKGVVNMFEMTKLVSKHLS